MSNGTLLMVQSVTGGLKQFGLNTLVMADLNLNGFLGGSPRETLSRRTARARAAGSRPACVFCAVLTAAFNVILRPKRDHCTWALAGGDGIDAEVWHWSPPSEATSTPTATSTTATLS
jgi:hypothetical protein